MLAFDDHPRTSASSLCANALDAPSQLPDHFQPSAADFLVHCSAGLDRRRMRQHRKHRPLSSCSRETPTQNGALSIVYDALVPWWCPIAVVLYPLRVSLLLRSSSLLQPLSVSTAAESLWWPTKSYNCDHVPVWRSFFALRCPPLGTRLGGGRRDLIWWEWKCLLFNSDHCRSNSRIKSCLMLINKVILGIEGELRDPTHDWKRRQTLRTTQWFDLGMLPEKCIEFIRLNNFIYPQDYHLLFAQPQVRLKKSVSGLCTLP